MGLRIQNNISALNAHRNLTVSDGLMSKSLERLSSGYRINRAADDAAGLAISSSFRANIASFKVAARNTSESNSLLQVAEGAGDLISNMLTRLKELATQASSANASGNESKINSEASQILAEIDRIANSTKYGSTKLIDGSYGVSLSTTGSSVTAANGFSGLAGMKANYSYTIDVNDAAGTDTNVQISAHNGSGTTVGIETVVGFAMPDTGSTKDLVFTGLGLTLTINSSLSATNLTGGTVSQVHAKDAGASTFQVGAANNGNDQITIALNGMRASDLGLSNLSLATASAAQSALTSIDTAVSNLASTRGLIGAYQNRLSFASANLASTIENMSAADSVIRDVDMADEMTTFTKHQILLQAGTAMLAQANQSPQGILALLR